MCDGVQRLQRWLWDRKGHDQHHHTQQQHTNQQQQQHANHTKSQQLPRWGKLLLLLPDVPGLRGFRHNVFQTALIAAAKGGRVVCLQQLLGQLPQCRVSALDCAEALAAVAEAAAAAGHLGCLQLVWQVLQPPADAPAAAAAASGSCGAQRQQQWQMGVEGRGSQQATGVGDLVGAMAQLHMQPQHEQQQQQEQQPAALSLAEQQQQYVQQQRHNHQQQQQQQVQPPPPPQEATRPPNSAVQLVDASTYLLVAAAGSGSYEVVSAVMQRMQVGVLVGLGSWTVG